MPARPRDESVDERVRRRLRELRHERGLTLAQVAERASIDLSTLSRLESGKRRIALDHLPALAAALGVSSDRLLEPARQQNPRVQAEPLVIGGMTFLPLTRRGAAAGLHTYKIHISARHCAPPETLPVHEGNDWLFVLSGRMRLILGDDDLTIEPGEAVEFTTWTPHWFGAIDTAVEAIGIFGPQGDRFHLHE